MNFTWPNLTSQASVDIDKLFDGYTTVAINKAENLMVSGRHASFNEVNKL